MAPHAYWTGHIRLSLVTFAVRLYPAITIREKVRLHKYERQTGQRIHYRNVNEEGKLIEDGDIVKGYAIDKVGFVPIEEEELESLKQESKHTIDLVQFTDISSIDPVYFENPYYVSPENEVAEEAFATLREALRKTGKIALGQVVLNNKERIVAIKPFGVGLLLETLRYHHEVRSPHPYFENIRKKITLKKEQLELAEQLIEKKAAEFDPKKFKDRFQEGLLEIIHAKKEHRPPKLRAQKVKLAKVVNIMDALRESLKTRDSVKNKKARQKIKTVASKKVVQRVSRKRA